MAWNPVFVCCVAGKPEPAGSKRGFVFTPKGGGKPRASIVDANTKSTDWKKRVALEVAQKYQYPGAALLDGPIMVRFVFYRVRPKNHYRTGRNSGLLRDDAPEFPTPKPDVLKLARGVEDALTGVVWKDDAQIVSEAIHKRWASRPGVKLEIFRWNR